MFHDVERLFERIYILGIKKNKFGRNRGIDLLYRRMPLRIHNLLLDVLKTTLLKSMKRCFKVSKGKAKTFSVSRASKIANEVILQGVERLCEFIFCIMVIEKSELDEVV
jgi:hypothetical protein